MRLPVGGKSGIFTNSVLNNLCRRARRRSRWLMIGETNGGIALDVNGAAFTEISI